MKKVMISMLIAVCGTFVWVTDSAEGTITDVNVLPEEPTVNEVITIVTYGVELSGPVLINQSDFHMEDSSLELDIFVEVGLLGVITPWCHSEIVGTLPADFYDLTVHAYYSGAYPGTDTYSTSFTVVPEPASVLLLWVGIVGVRASKRRS